MMSVINPHIMNVFGFKNYLIIGGFTRLFNQLNSFFSALTSVLISLKYKTGKELKIPYIIVSSVGLIFACIGFILSFQENDEKFKFKIKDEYMEDNFRISNFKISSTEYEKQSEEK